VPFGPFPNSPSEPGMPLSRHPALPLSVILRRWASAHRRRFLCISPIFMRTSPLIGYLCSGTPDRLRPFARWPAFPASDYYGRSDAPQVSLPDCWEHPFQGSLSRSGWWTLRNRLGGGSTTTHAALRGIPAVGGVGQVDPPNPLIGRNASPIGVVWRTEPQRQPRPPSPLLPRGYTGSWPVPPGLGQPGTGATFPVGRNPLRVPRHATP
jgi:hypothetical protein